MSDTDYATRVELALAGAKALRRDAGFLVQQLAQLRDSQPNATTQEGTSTDERTND